MPTDAGQASTKAPVSVRKMTEKGMKLNAKGTALHRQLYVLLKEQIASGRYRLGELLPTQEALCRQFSISRITVRRALNDLVEDGFVRNRQGVGAFVAADIGRARQGPDFSFIGDMRRTLKETTMKILLLETGRCPGGIAAHFGLADDEPALHLVRTRSYGDRPVTLLDG